MKRSPTIADQFLRAFGAEAWNNGYDRGLAALEWLSTVDPDGTGQLVDGGIAYHFSDKSSLIYDRESKLFAKPQ